MNHEPSPSDAVQLVESSRSGAKIQPVISISEEVFLKWGDATNSSQSSLLLNLME